MTQNIHDVIIIGSGPAGYTAAIYCARAEMKPLIITGLEPGGQLTTTNDVENFPGYPNGITGPEMMIDLENQAKRFGTEVIMDYVTEVQFHYEGNIHLVKTASQEFKTKTIIIATGASAKYLGYDYEQKYRGSGVSACATCDGFFYRGKDVVVVGGGDTAAEEATYLSKICNKVYMLVRKEMRASKIMQDRVLHAANIELLEHHELHNIEGNGVVEKVTFINNQTQETREVAVDGVFIAIGHKPNTDLFAGKLATDESGYLILEGNNTATSIAGVFAAGDVADKIYRQAITAAGSGCMAALDAERYLHS